MEKAAESKDNTASNVDFDIDDINLMENAEPTEKVQAREPEQIVKKKRHDQNKNKDSRSKFKPPRDGSK